MFKFCKDGVCTRCEDRRTRYLSEGSPEPLFECMFVNAQPCYACGGTKAYSALYSTITFKPLIPLCENCSFRWNVHGYAILSKIGLKVVIKLLLRNLFSCMEIYRNIKKIQAWGNKMKRFKI